MSRGAAEDSFAAPRLMRFSKLFTTALSRGYPSNAAPRLAEPNHGSEVESCRASTSVRSKDFPEIKVESRKNRIAADDRGFLDVLRRLIRAVNRRGVIDRVQQPGETRAIVDVLLHLVLQGGKPIRSRAQLDHEIGADSGA